MDRFRILPGLPATGPWPEQFTVAGRGTHREGVVVEFLPNTGSSWVGNFQPGGSAYDTVMVHPNGREVIVVAHGQAYLIDPETRQLLSVFGDGGIYCVLPIPSAEILVINKFGLWLEALGKEGFLWRTRRVSWDGINDLREVEGKVFGESWDVANDCGVPFSVDILTGEAQGGAYPFR